MLLSFNANTPITANHATSGVNLKYIGIAATLIALTGIIHFIDAPGSFDDATYKGVLFILNGIFALVAAYGVYRGKTWGWLVGLAVAGGAFVMYIVSRTLGLPGIGVDDEWFEPLGVMSLIVEFTFVVMALVALNASRAVNPAKNQ